MPDIAADGVSYFASAEGERKMWTFELYFGYHVMTERCLVPVVLTSFLVTSTLTQWWPSGTSCMSCLHRVFRGKWLDVSLVLVHKTATKLVIPSSITPPTDRELDLWGEIANTRPALIPPISSECVGDWELEVEVNCAVFAFLSKETLSIYTLSTHCFSHNYYDFFVFVLYQVSSGQNVLKRSAKFLQRLRKMQEQFAAQVELLTKTELEKCRKESTDTSSPFFLGSFVFSCRSLFTPRYSRLGFSSTVVAVDRKQRRLKIIGSDTAQAK